MKRVIIVIALILLLDSVSTLDAAERSLHMGPSGLIVLYPRSPKPFHESMIREHRAETEIALLFYVCTFLSFDPELLGHTKANRTIPLSFNFMFSFLMNCLEY